MKKVFKYIILGLLVALGLYVLVEFIINKDGTMYWLNYIWDLLNKPLPIIGITTLALLLFVWNVIVFVRKNQPAKELAELKKEHAQYVEDSEQEKQEIRKSCLDLLEQLIHICELSTNQKINNFGKELENYGKDTNSETKAD